MGQREPALEDLTHRSRPDLRRSASDFDRAMSSPGDGAGSASRQIKSVAILCGETALLAAAG